MAKLKEGSTVGGDKIATEKELNKKEDKLTEDEKRKISISTADPSGGSDGDIWLKYE